MNAGARPDALGTVPAGYPPVPPLVAAVVAAAMLPLVATLALGGRLPWVMDGPGYLLFHGMAEFFSAAVALSVFGVGWFSYDQSRDRYTLFLGSAFLAIGLLDLAHTFAYAGMPETANRSTQLWLAARQVSALAFLASAFVMPRSSGRLLAKPLLLALGLGIPAAVLSAVTLLPDRLPAAVDDQGVTWPAQGSGYLMVLVLLLAVGAYWRRARRTGERALPHMVAALLLCVVGELTALIPTDARVAYNVLGHLYKDAAFLLIYAGVFTRAVTEPYAALSGEMTERRAAEEKLGRNRRILEETYRLTRVGGWEYDVRSGRLTWTDELYRLYGMPRDTDPSALAPEALHPPEDRQRLKAAFAQAVKEGIPYDLELRLDNLRGEHLWVRVIGCVERQDDEVVRLYGYAMDVTERKHGEQELEQYFKLFSVSADLMGIADPRGAFQRVNPAFTAMLGWSEEQLLAKPFMEFVHPEDRQSTAEEMARQAERGFSLDFENRYLCADGSARWLSWRAYVNPADGLTYATARDITERKRAHEDLRHQAEELRLRNDELQAFNEALVGRELTMIRLKEEVNGLARELGRAPPYPTEVFATEERVPEAR